MKNVVKGAAIGVVLVLAVVGLLSLFGCRRDRVIQRDLLICAPCHGHGKTRVYEEYLSRADFERELICFSGVPPAVCWYGCDEVFSAEAAARCGEDD